MSAPKRWLDDPEATGMERDLLRSGAAMDPPPGAQGEVWAALLTKLPPPGAPPSPGNGAAGKAAVSKAAATGGKAAALAKGAGGVAAGAGILKSALIGAGSAVALLATYSAVTPSHPPEAPPPVVAAPPADPAPQKVAAPAPPRAPEPAATASAAASAEPVVEHHAEPRAPSTEAKAAAGAPPTAEERETMLREESRLVGEARDALRGGDAAGALGKLEQIRAKFPGGVLTQEREALTIEALARSGRKADAAARAAGFLKAYPSSPLAARVQQLAQ